MAPVYLLHNNRTKITAIWCCQLTWLIVTFTLYPQKYRCPGDNAYDCLIQNWPSNFKWNDVYWYRELRIFFSIELGSEYRYIVHRQYYNFGHRQYYNFIHESWNTSDIKCLIWPRLTHYSMMEATKQNRKSVLALTIPSGSYYCCAGLHNLLPVI